MVSVSVTYVTMTCTVGTALAGWPCYPFSIDHNFVRHCVQSCPCQASAGLGVGWCRHGELLVGRRQAQLLAGWLHGGRMCVESRGGRWNVLRGVAFDIAWITAGQALPALIGFPLMMAQLRELAGWSPQERVTGGDQWERGVFPQLLWGLNRML